MAKRKSVTLAGPKGDHGPGLQIAGTYLEDVPDDKNGMKRRRNKIQLDFLHRGAIHKLTLRQWEAGCKVRDAHARVEALSSGQPLKQKVDSSPKPDQAIAAQVDALSKVIQITKGIDRRLLRVVAHVCCNNLPLGEFSHPENPAPWADLCVALDLVANRCRL